MNWEAIGAVGEILGAAGVIATLGYLIVQIKQNTRSTESATLHALISDISQMTDPLFDPRLNAIWLNGLRDLGSLNVEDRHQFTILLTKNFVHWVDVFHQTQRGLVPKSFANGYDRDMVYLMGHPSVREVWEETKFSFGDDFAEYLENLLRSHSFDRLPKFQRLDLDPSKLSPLGR